MSPNQNPITDNSDIGTAINPHSRFLFLWLSDQFWKFPEHQLIVCQKLFSADLSDWAKSLIGTCEPLDLMAPRLKRNSDAGEVS